MGKALREHLAQRVHVVGIDAHDVARLVGVKEADGERLHLVEHRLSRVGEEGLRDDRHQPRIEEGAEDGDGEDNAYYRDEAEQLGKICLAAAFDRIYYLFHLTDHVVGHEDIARRSRHAEQDAHEDEDHMYFIVFEQRFEEHAHGGGSAVSYFFHSSSSCLPLV